MPTTTAPPRPAPIHRARATRPAATAELPTRLPLTASQRRLALERAAAGPWFDCAGCGELRPDSLLAGRTGRDHLCAWCAHQPGGLAS